MKIKLGAFHIYIVIFGMFFVMMGIIKQWVLVGIIGFIIWAVYTSQGIEYIMFKEEGFKFRR